MGKYLNMFHFHGFQPVSKNSLHAAMCTKSKSSDYAPGLLSDV